MDNRREGENTMKILNKINILQFILIAMVSFLFVQNAGLAPYSLLLIGMTLTHSTAIRSVLADALVDAVDGGSGDANGDLVFMTSGDVEVATLAFANPAFGAASSGVATANAIADDTNATGGTVELFKIQNLANTEVVRGSVTATSGGGDIELSSVVVGVGDTVSISSLTYTASI
jgi:hypothetical protein